VANAAVGTVRVVVRVVRDVPQLIARTNHKKIVRDSRRHALFDLVIHRGTRGGGMIRGVFVVVVLFFVPGRGGSHT
jgi:hypothetical protein